ncbi:hypothetical protein EPUS_01695 [Endocarpon pusillum Z07020]|uniref:NmrA-like domain-containing protein n=1 Tax=Endocarpon pusillum (strain Z07020 / HMAS-L-300199) TaxID=1263415 RepID=U1HN58_ENDPU|nr:uncharacterized protein EPUS_01695 [Endocarpon pusillum Z07020]ERF71780.1 hypothetical protein EPUS_01695 [Endocarpon pusillum Z07020]
MKVAIAGTSNVAQYLIEELTTYGHDVIVLTRNPKREEKKVEHRVTDYSVASLVAVLKDCDALVSTIADFSNPPAATEIHFNMLEACIQSRKCKTFIPSEWTHNVEDYPEQPMFLADANKALHQRLKEEMSIRWTIICNSWFTDYVVRKSQRYLRDLGPLWPMDFSSKVFTIYGPGTQIIDLTPVRDVAKAVAVLIDSKEPWEQHTYLSGDQLSWNDLFAIIKRRDPEWTSQNKPLANTIHQITANESPESVFLGHFEILSYSGALALPKEKVLRQRSKYFQDIHFRTVDEILETAAARDGIV